MQRLELTPRQNQDFRILLRVCQKSLVAINGSGCPLVLELLRLHSTSPSLLNAIFAIAAQARASQCEPSSPSAWEPYHAALIEVQQMLSRFGSNGSDSEDDLLAPLAGAAILILLSLDGPDDDWQHHAQQVVHMIDAHGAASISSSRLGMLLLMTAAHIDISAFALGRSTISTDAWLRWNLIDEPQQSETLEFLDFEVVTGYPSDLITLIAQLSQCADASRSSQFSVGSNNIDNGAILEERKRLKTQLELWTPPSIPHRMSGTQRLALSKAWKVMLHAAKLYHQRGHGFHSDLSIPVDGISQTALMTMVEEIITGIEYLVNTFRTSDINTANSMAWALAVAGSECGDKSMCHLQSLVLQLTKDLDELFLMSHLRFLTTVFKQLWIKHGDSEALLASKGFSIESVACESGFTIPLL